MSGEYVISFTDPAEGSFTIVPNTLDGPGQTNHNTPLLLHGRFIPNYGEIVSNNLLKLLENFAHTTEPTKPITGMLWFDKKTTLTNTDGVLKVRNADNTDWVEVGSSSASGGAGGRFQHAPSGNFTAMVGGNYFVNTSTGAVTVLFPSNPQIGDIVGFCDVAGTFNNYSLFCDGNGKLIMGDPSVMENNVRNSFFKMCFSGDTYGWRLVG